MKKNYLKTIVKIIAGLIICLVLIYLVRRPVMRVTGNYLIEEDRLTVCDAMFILSGGPADRSAEASRILKKGYAPYVVCTGESVPYLFDLIDVNLDEADLTRMALLRLGIPDSRIKKIHAGTSTREESEIILNYCRSAGLKKVMVISDKFHTNRINYAFRQKFEQAGIELVLRGAPSGVYNEANWWASESGLIMVNNEYIKLCYYYFIK